MVKILQKDFRTLVELSGKVVKLGRATFKAGASHGKGEALLDISEAPARITGNVALSGVKLHTLTAFLPPSLRGIRGSASAAAQFSTRGLTRQEMNTNLEGKMQLNLKDVSVADFDLVGILAREGGLGELETLRGELGLHTLAADLEIRDRRATFENVQMDLGGAELNLTGAYRFDGETELTVAADLRHVRRRFLTVDEAHAFDTKEVSLRLAGPLYNLVVVRETQAARVER